MQKLISCYVLTFNSERHLKSVLEAARKVCDEILIVDSGSSDRSVHIAQEAGCQVLYNKFVNFSKQRAFAIEKCKHNWILSLDSDEVMSPALIQTLSELKDKLDPDVADAYAIRRDWYVTGRKVHCFYPSTCPDWPIRLFYRSHLLHFEDRQVHEAIRGFAKARKIRDPILHLTSDSLSQLYEKINRYTSLSAIQMRNDGETGRWWKVLILPLIVSLQWYLLRGGWKDGGVGIVLALYVAETIYKKQAKLLFDDFELQGDR